METPEHQKRRDNEDFIPRRLLCATENPATGNKTMTLPVSLVMLVNRFLLWFRSFLPVPSSISIWFFTLLWLLVHISCHFSLFSCHSHLLEIFQTKSEYSQKLSFDSAMHFLSLIEAIALYGLILMHLY